jgi:hypothetical protein
MSRPLRTLWLIALAFDFSGCVTPGNSNFQYAQAKPTVVANEAQFEEPFDAVWDRLVGRLATGFFVVNNIDKASRLINVSYSSDTPEKYVDCGRSTRQYSFRDDHQTFTYDVAAHSRFKATGKWGPFNNLPVVYDVSRETGVEGRINLYVAPIDPAHTKVSVNVKYVLSVKISGVGTGYNAFGGVMQQVALPGASHDIALTSAEPATKDWGTAIAPEFVTCRSNGSLEAELLSKAKP